MFVVALKNLGRAQGCGRGRAPFQWGSGQRQEWHRSGSGAGFWGSKGQGIQQGTKASGPGMHHVDLLLQLRSGLHPGPLGPSGDI